MPRSSRTVLGVLGLVVLLVSAGCGGPEADRVLGSPSPGATGDAVHASAEERRVAVPPDAVPSGIRVCSAFDVPSMSGRDDGGAGPLGEGSGMVLYGEVERDDPYTGPMLGVMWGDEGGHAGDGTRTPVEVRGRSGEAAPITVFQQVVLEELGTVVAWREQDLSVGFYGRFWGDARTDDLIALANELEFADGAFHLPADALPEGYGEVSAGGPDGLGLILSGREKYRARYQVRGERDALVNVTGLVQDEDEFGSVRFFGHGLGPDGVEGRRALIGDAWREGVGPAVVTWREEDGLVVRVVGMGAELDTSRAMARAARELSEEEWEGMVDASDRCPRPGPPMEPPADR